MSPEAPVPVVEVDRKEQRVGGAGNVVKNLSTLGAIVDLISVVGNDDAGHALSSMLAPYGTAHLIVDASSHDRKNTYHQRRTPRGSGR